MATTHREIALTPIDFCEKSFRPSNERSVLHEVGASLFAVNTQLEANCVAEHLPVRSNRMNGRCVGMHLVHAQHATFAVAFVYQDHAGVNDQRIGNMMLLKKLQASLQELVVWYTRFKL